MIFLGYFLLILMAIQAMEYDRDLAEEFDRDNVRTKQENDLLHSKQTPMIGASVLLVSFIVILVEFGQFLQWETVWYILHYCFFFWVVFDLSCNIFWLKVHPFYTGTTWWPEKKYRWRLWIVKFAGLIATLTFILI